MPNRDWDATNGFEDPVDWITTLSPKCTNGTSQRYRPSGRPAVHPDGSLLTVAGSVPPTVYVLQNGQKRGIPTPERLRELYGPGRGFDFTDIIIVEQDELNQYPTGAPVPVSEPIFDSGLCEPAGRLIQQDGREEISIVTGDCIRRPFGLGQAFLRLGYSTCNVWQIFDYSDPIYTVGPPITQ
ncbi:MAG: hypothetical protein HYR55_18785 [Acidobacteria bacterium]|nr:hypothetical protein [Acidobacteriota bacterium]MBI3656545.1 hypothetical protein [Acidobacteriota bacterium]